LFADQQTSDIKEGQEQIQLTGTKSPTGYDTTGSTGIDQEQNQQQKNQPIQQNPDYYIPKVYHEADEVCVQQFVYLYIGTVHFKYLKNIINISS